MHLEKEILKVLAYFDIFHYPLSATEIRRFLANTPGGADFDLALKRLLSDKRIYKYGDFYSLKEDKVVVSKRSLDNKRAERLLSTAYKLSSFLFQFPYVRGIGISGSLSKNVAKENADIDFFVITKSNRLWIARTIMHLFKKLTFIIGCQHWFCMNYYIDEEALVIPEKNYFTAIEVITLLPVCGNGTMKRFFEANDWAGIYFPNYQLNKDSHKKARSSVLKKAVEWVFDNRFGEWLDDRLMKVTSGRWLKKENRYKVNIKGNRIGLCTGKHFARPNPEFFQGQVLLVYENKLNEIEKFSESLVLN